MVTVHYEHPTQSSEEHVDPSLPRIENTGNIPHRKSVQRQKRQILELRSAEMATAIEDHLSGKYPAVRATSTDIEVLRPLPTQEEAPQNTLGESILPHYGQDDENLAEEV
jgi:hypothetical protein